MSYLFYLAEFVAPLLLAFRLPRPMRPAALAVVGVVAYVAICISAYRGGLVENGGDLTGGAADLLLVVIVNALHFIPLYSLGALVGWKFRTRRDSQLQPQAR